MKKSLKKLCAEQAEFEKKYVEWLKTPEGQASELAAQEAFARFSEGLMSSGPEGKRLSRILLKTCSIMSLIDSRRKAD